MTKRTKILLASGVILLMTAGAAGWLLTTEKGQETLIRTALPWVPGLTVGEADGHFFDLKLKNLVWTMPGLSLSADEVHLALNRDALFEKRLVIEKLTAGRFHGRLISAELPASESKPKDDAPITMPIPIELHGFEVADLAFEADDVGIRLGYAAGEATWTADRLTVEPLVLRTLTVTLPKSTSESATTDTEAVTTDKPTDVLHTQQTVSFDPALLRQTLRDIFGRPLIQTLPDVSLPFHLAVKGIEGTDWRLEGTTPVTINQVTLSGVMAASDLQLDTFDVVMPEGVFSLTGTAALARTWPMDLRAKARLQATPLVGETAELTLVGNVLGKLTLAARTEGPVPAHALIATELATPGLPLSVSVLSKGFNVPLATPAKTPVTRMSDINLRFQGSAQHWTLRGGLKSDTPATPPAILNLDAHGTLEEVELRKLTAKTADGIGTLTAKADWRDVLNIKGDLTLDDLGLHHFLPELPAVVSGGASLSAHVTPKGWSVEVPIFDIKGKVNQAELLIHGAVTAQDPMKIYAPNIKVTLGDNHLDGLVMVDGHHLKADVKVHAPNLVNTLPGLTGRAEGFVKIGGTLAEPIVDADLTASNLQYDETGLAALILKGRINAKPSGEVGGDLLLHASDAKIPGLDVHDLAARLNGTDRHHKLEVTLTGEPVAGALTLAGGFNAKTQVWTGILEKGRINSPIGNWSQNNVAKLVINLPQKEAVLDPHCWSAKTNEVCLAEPLVAAEKGAGALALKRFDLDVLKPFLPDATRVSGTVTADARARWDLPSGKMPVINARVNGEGVTVTQTMNDKAVPIHLDTFTLSAKTDQKGAQAQVQALIRDNGGITGHASVTDPLKTRRLSGALKVDPINLAIINPLISTGEKAAGTLTGDLTFGGTLQKPELQGELTLQDVTVKDGAVPVVMKPSHVSVSFEGTRSTLSGTLETTKGTLNLKGDASWHDMSAPRATLRADGKDILITVPPYASVLMSPDVIFTATPTLLTLDGNIDVPSAKITVSDLPETAVGLSSDEVMLDRHMVPKVTRTAAVPIASNLTVHIGDQVWLDAFGLTARLTGDLRVTQDRRRGLGLNGQVNVVDGRFHAYGQDLTVREGQVIFSGPPDRPQLNIEAIRNPDAIEDNVTAGIRVTGNAQRPKVSVFSEPVLSQQAALSYLLRGQGLSASTEDNAMITSLLIGLGVSQTGSIVGAIGDAVGIRDLGIDTTGVGDSSQVVVSGYILPGLQLKYGVGIFDSLATITLRYRLMPRLYLEAISGVNQVFDVLYSFEF